MRAMLAVDNLARTDQAGILLVRDLRGRQIASAIGAFCAWFHNTVRTKRLFMELQILVDRLLVDRPCSSSLRCCGVRWLATGGSQIAHVCVERLFRSIGQINRKIPGVLCCLLHRLA